MSAKPSTARQVLTPDRAAELLHERGFGKLQVEADQHLFQALINSGVRAAQIGDLDLKATRAVFERLIDGAITDPCDPPHLAVVATESRERHPIVSPMSRRLGEAAAKSKAEAGE